MTKCILTNTLYLCSPPTVYCQSSVQLLINETISCRLTPKSNLLTYKKPSLFPLQFQVYSLIKFMLLLREGNMHSMRSNISGTLPYLLKFLSVSSQEEWAHSASNYLQDKYILLFYIYCTTDEKSVFSVCFKIQKERRRF